MEINYPIAGAVVLFAVLLLIFLIRKNAKDEKKFEKDENQSGEPETHKEDSV